MKNFTLKEVCLFDTGKFKFDRKYAAAIEETSVKGRR